MKTISRAQAAKKSIDYAKMLECEDHHDHKIIEDTHGVWRWERVLKVDKIVTGKLDLNYLVLILEYMGFDKNSEVQRKLYRDMGYSLSGYYDVFYWDVNNDKADKYRRPITAQDFKDKDDLLNKWIAEADLRAKERDKSDDRLMAGRDYLMKVNPENLTVEDCFEAFGWTRDGFNKMD